MRARVFADETASISHRTRQRGRVGPMLWGASLHFAVPPVHTTTKVPSADQHDRTTAPHPADQAPSSTSRRTICPTTLHFALFLLYAHQHANGYMLKTIQARICRVKPGGRRGNLLAIEPVRTRTNRAKQQYAEQHKLLVEAKPTMPHRTA